MFFKDKNKNMSKNDNIFKNSDDSFMNRSDKLDVVDLDDAREVDIEKLFKASSFESRPDKIIIRDIDERKRPSWADIADDDIDEKPKKKVRRRIKKSSGSAGLKSKSYAKKKEKDTPEYVPLASETGNNRMDSDFRKQSADWMDKDYQAEYNGLSDNMGDNPSFVQSLKSAAPLQWVAAVLAVGIFASSIMTTTVYAKYQCAEKRVAAIGTLKTFEAAESGEVAKVVEDVEAPISTALAEPQISKILSLVLSSVEKDLKIKLVDEDDTLVKNVEWSVSVTDNDGKQSEESDDDRDGIIHMTDISAGDYTVELIPSSSLADFELPSGAQTVSVKAKVEYKVIANIKEEIKTEKEINAAVEDAGNKPADVEQTVAVADTVEWLESTKTATDEKYEESAVDLSKTAKNTSGNKLVAFFDNFKSVSRTTFGKYSTVAYPLILAEGHTHNYTYTSNNDGTHTKKCDVEGCTEEGTSESCSISDGKCSACGYEKPADPPPVNPPAEHEHNYTYTHNSDGTHTGTCSVSECPAPTVTEPCSGNESTECSKCHYKAQPAVVEHNLTYAPNNNGTHKVTCSVSGCNQNHNQANAACTYDSGSNNCKYCNAAKPAKTYTLSVTGGSGAGIYKEGDSVTVTASVPAGQVFSSWSTSGITLTDSQKKASTVTIKMPAMDVSLAAVFAVEEAKYADTAQLYDSNMNPLYVYEGGSYRLAKYSDYKKDKNQKFYKKVEAFLYTGWQTLNGKRYYYNRDNQPVTGDQVIGGVQYHFGTDGALSMGSGTLGIDVSKYQPSINWSSVKRSGINYVIIRCGYRGSSTGVLVEDPYFRSHIKGAKAAGLKVGVYFFTTAVTEAEAVEEASMVAYLCGGYGIDYPVFMDCESSPRAGYNGMSAGQRTAIIKAFCNTIRSAGYTPGVYANKTWLSSYMNAGELGGYKIWLAQYNSNGPTYGGRYDLWQYTSKGSVDGIPGNVDMNQSYLGY